MHNSSIFKFLLFFTTSLLFVSCDKEYSAVGDALIGDNNFELVKYPSNVVAYNEKITPIESNNLAVNAFGIYDNPAFDNQCWSKNRNVGTCLQFDQKQGLRSYPQVDKPFLV